VTAGSILKLLSGLTIPVVMAREADIDVFVELVGGDGDPAYAAALAALGRGRHLVTANKAMLARHGVELARLAESNGVLLNFEAAVAGGIPVIKVMRESLTGNSIQRIYGILNGTCNYILTRMQREDMGFAECLAEAQRLGYAEADPAFDIEGNDTAHKLAILTSLAFGTEIASDEVYVEGITNISIDDIHAADELGYRIKLLGVAQRTASGIEQRVHPTMVPKGSMIAQVEGVTNAVTIEADILGELMLQVRARGETPPHPQFWATSRILPRAGPGTSMPRHWAVPQCSLSLIGVPGCRAMRVATSYRSRSRTGRSVRFDRNPDGGKCDLFGIHRSTGAPGGQQPARKRLFWSPMRRRNPMSAPQWTASRLKAISLASRR
jgi:homoserine dehydrogenase